jgi:hypothetical protein
VNAFYFLLYVVAALLFLGAALAWYRPNPPRPVSGTLLALGLFAWVLVPLIQTFKTL